MEDEYFLSDEGRFAAVFDGHGGGGVSSYLRDRLYDKFQQHMRAYESDHDESGNHGSSHTSYPSIPSQVAAFRLAFDEVEKEVCMNEDLQYQGSTAVAVAVNEDADGTRTLLSANVGDSRAILSRRGRAIDLTRDHKPNDEREKARILGMVDQFNLSTDDVKDLSIAALIAKMIGLARTDSIRNELQGLLGMAKSTGIAGNQASSIVTAKAAQGDA